MDILQQISNMWISSFEQLIPPDALHILIGDFNEDLSPGIKQVNLWLMVLQSYEHSARQRQLRTNGIMTTTKD